MKVKCIKDVINENATQIAERGDLFTTGLFVGNRIELYRENHKKRKLMIDRDVFEFCFEELDKIEKCRTCNFIKSVKEYYKDNSVSIGVEFTIFTYTDLEKEIQNSKTPLKSGIYNYCPECGQKID